MIYVKPEIDAAVYSPQLHNSVAGVLNCSICCRSVVVLEDIPLLHKERFNAQWYGTAVLQNLLFGSVVTLLYDLRVVQYIFSQISY